MMAARSPQLRALLFDFGGTLDANGVPWKARFLKLWREEVGQIEPDIFEKAFHEADDALVGTVSPQLSLRETARRLADGLAHRLSPGNESVAERVGSRFCLDATKPLAESTQLFARLAPRYRLGVVSNFYGNLAAVCGDAGLSPWLSATIDSAAVGATKPDRRIFQAALSALDVDATQAIFIGDSLPRDMEGARSVGMRHVLLAGDAPGVPAAGCCPGDPVLRRLTELPEVLS